MIVMDLPILFVAAFFCELIDTSVGGGYGTILVPLSISMGVNPLHIIPAVLFSEICTGFLGGFFHHRFKNVDFRIVGLDALLGFFGIALGVFMGVSIPAFLLKAWIGLIVLACGFLLILCLKGWFLVRGGFKLRNDVPLTLLCSFNKGLSGGGYGPISTAGLIIIRADPKKSVGSTILSEGIVCVIGLLLFNLLGKASLDLNPLALTITVGACLATPFGAYVTQKIDAEKLKFVIAIFIVLLGFYTLFKAFF